MLDLITNRTGGSYYYTDLNRVGDALLYLGELLRKYGYIVNICPKRDWVMEDKPTPESMTNYLGCVSSIRAVMTVFPTTPHVPPDMEYLTYQEANDIEKILFDIEQLINNMQSAWFYSGEIYSGEV